VPRQELATLRAGYREIKRLVKHGPSYPWRRYVAPAEILKAKAIHTDRSGEVTVCVLTSRRDWLSCLWSLVSFYEFSGLQLPLLIYSDGTLAESQLREMARVFPEARILSSAQGEAAVLNQLSGYPNCVRFRGALLYGRKLIDLPILSGSRLVLILDSDVLFLQRPDELMRHLVPNGSRHFVFERDMQDAYFAPRGEIQERFNVDIASCVNTGIMVADVSRFDYAKIEQWLGDGLVENHPWAEQTLWAMYAGRERTVLLGEGYDVTMSAHIEANTVAKHYIGPIRDFLYMEGIPYLSRYLEPGVGCR
jgi:hypothetical protein